MKHKNILEGQITPELAAKLAQSQAILTDARKKQNQLRLFVYGRAAANVFFVLLAIGLLLGAGYWTYSHKETILASAREQAASIIPTSPDQGVPQNTGCENLKTKNNSIPEVQSGVCYQISDKEFWIKAFEQEKNFTAYSQKLSKGLNLPLEKAQSVLKSSLETGILDLR